MISLKRIRSWTVALPWAVFVVVSLLCGPAIPAALATGIAPAAGVQPTNRGLDASLTLTVDGLGVGGRARAGAWTPVLVGVLNRDDREREIVLRVETRDADGDRPAYDRVITANRATKQNAWLYLRLPMDTQPGDTLRIAAYEAVESSAPEAVEGFGAGRLLAETVHAVSAQELVAEHAPMLGVVGRRTLGLSALGERALGNGDHHPLGHAPTEVVGQIDPQALPDRWFGLASFDTIVFADAQPQDLRQETGTAVSAWVARGGHLIVVLPGFGQQWFSRINNPLFDLLPVVNVSRVEGVSAEPLRPLLTGSPEADLPDTLALHYLDVPAGASPADASAVIASPGGRGLVVRRLVGAGCVTVIGLDLNDSALSGRGLPQADVFWNRVLGRRGALVDSAGLAALAQDNFRTEREETVYADQWIGPAVAQTGRAAAGVLLGFVVFGVYWAIAGPLGFAALRKLKRDRHAWAAFGASAVLFTAGTWGAATAMRPKDVVATHVTFLTHVYGEPNQIARSWVGLLLPEYGAETIALPEPALGGLGANVLAPWEPVSTEFVRSRASFPDSRSYRVDARSPSSMRVPSRQTVKQFESQWAGVTAWGGMPRPVTDASGAASTIRAATDAASGPFAVRGRIVHDLPSPLLETLVLVNRGQRALGAELRGATPGRFIANAGAFRLAGRLASWESGVEIDLAEVTGRAADLTAGLPTAESVFDRLTPVARSALFGDPGRLRTNPLSAFESALTGLFYRQLAPPQLRRGESAREAVVYQSSTHGLDLSRWLTEPCVIVVGRVEQPDAVEMPVPMLVEDRPVKGRGRTIVAWVYPLEPTPPGYGAP